MFTLIKHTFCSFLKDAEEAINGLHSQKSSKNCASVEFLDLNRLYVEPQNYYRHPTSEHFQF